MKSIEKNRPSLLFSSVLNFLKNRLYFMQQQTTNPQKTVSNINISGLPSQQQDYEASSVQQSDFSSVQMNIILLIQAYMQYECKEWIPVQHISLRHKSRKWLLKDNYKGNWGQAAKLWSPHCFYLFFLFNFFILLLKSMAARWTIWSKVVKSGTLIEWHAKRPWCKFDVDWQKGGNIANS